MTKNRKELLRVFYSPVDGKRKKGRIVDLPSELRGLQNNKDRGHQSNVARSSKRRTIAQRPTRAVASDQKARRSIDKGLTTLIDALHRDGSFAKEIAKLDFSPKSLRYFDKIIDKFWGKGSATQERF